jgi:plastocyanin
MRIATVVTIAALLFIIIPVPGISQTLHVIISSGMTFSPSEITISDGDTVRWENQSGFHNVVADDASFTNGAPSSSAWEFTRVFPSVGNFQYYCSVHGDSGGVGMSGIIHVTNSTGVVENTDQPVQFAVKQNYPNPFNPSTLIGYTLPQNGLVTVKIFTLLGKELATLVHEKESQGDHTVQFQAGDLSSGIYFYRIQFENSVQIRKMLLLR